MAENRQPALMLEKVQVRADRMVCQVRVTDPAFANTNSRIARRARALFPHLPEHACVNDEGTRFGLVMDHTDLPHLLEHMVIDLQVQRSNSDKVFTGVTRWVDRAAGVASIEMCYSDDLVALRAFRDAVDMINEKICSEREER